MKNYKIFGIKSCDTMKKTFDWFKQQGIEYQFHDYKKEGISNETLQNWCTQSDWKTLLNTKGTTWRKADEKIKEATIDSESAIEFMKTNTSAIKRPVITLNDQIIDIGFNQKLD